MFWQATILSALVLGAAPGAKAVKPERVWRVEQQGSGPLCGADEQPILAAIAQAGAEGGTVEIGPGEYTVRRTIVLGSKLTLRGHGATLRLPPPTTTRARAAKGDSRIEVRDASPFLPGGVLEIVPPGKAKTFPASDKEKLLAPIEDVSGHTIVLGSPLECDVPEASRVGYDHNLIRVLPAAQDVRIEHLQLEGGRDPEIPMPGHVHRCAVFAAGRYSYGGGPSAPPVENLQVLGCEIRNFYGRAVALYSVVKSKVAGCTIADIADEAVDFDHFTYHCEAIGNRITRSVTGVTINDGSYCTVADNRIDQCGVGVTIWWWHMCPQTDIDRENVIRDNYVWRPKGPAISLGRRCFRNRVENNFVDGPVKVAERDNTVGGNVTIGKLKGRVTGEGRPLADVLVSDGCRVVRTGAAGCYEIMPGPESGPFVFVTNPAGYWTDAFYVPLGTALAAGETDFALRAVTQSPRFDFAFITDMHLENRTVGVPKTLASIREINALSPRPAFLLAQGDICLQGHSGPVYQECLREAAMPVRNGPGNHEMMHDALDPRADFHRLFGPTYYSFDWAGLHSIVLDGNKVIPGLKSYKAVHGAVEGSELAWLEADLAAQPRGRPIVVGIHIPIVSTYAERRAENPKDAPYWEVANRAPLTDLFARHGVRLVLQGHMHENERATVKGVEYVESISLSGSWFKSGPGMERGVDGSPRGYRVVSVDGDKITHRYCSTAESRVQGQGEFVGLDKPLRAGRPVELVFNCYDAPNGSTAEARIDGGPWQPMPPFAAINPAHKLKMPHHFRLEAGPLPVGPHEVEAQVHWPDGTTATGRAKIDVGR